VGIEVEVSEVSWFEYGTPEKRSWRKGVALRVRDLPPELLAYVNRYKGRFQQIFYVLVLEIQDDGYVLLEYHCGRKLMSPKQTVITQHVKENPAWICEGDLGRGYVEENRKKRAPSKLQVVQAELDALKDQVLCLHGHIRPCYICDNDE